MENEKNYITKKDFYAVAMHLCILILFTGMVSNKGDDLGKLFVVIWAAGLGIYCIYQMRKAQKEQMDL